MERKESNFILFDGFVELRADELVNEIIFWDEYLFVISGKILWMFLLLLRSKRWYKFRATS